MSKLVRCFTMHEEERMIPAQELVFRPGAYGLIVHEEKVLLTITKSTGKFMPPGGGVHLGESLEEAATREIREECGVDAMIERFLFFKERFFYYEPSKSAWHGYLFFFLGKPLTFEVSDQMNPDVEDESIKPQWVEISHLKASDFQVCGELIMEELKRLSRGE